MRSASPTACEGPEAQRRALDAAWNQLDEPTFNAADGYAGIVRANAEISAVQLLAPHHTSDDAASARTHSRRLSFGSANEVREPCEYRVALPALILGGVVSTTRWDPDRPGRDAIRSRPGAVCSRCSLERAFSRTRRCSPRGTHERGSSGRRSRFWRPGSGSSPRNAAQDKRGAPSRARPELEPASRCEAPQSRRRRQRPPASSRCVLKNSHAAAVASISSRAHACTRPSTRTSRTSASQPL